MKGMTKVRSELSTKLVLLQGDVDLNNDQIARLQEQNVETQGQIEAVSKVLELIGSAWTPPKKATKKFIKKKVTKKSVLDCQRIKPGEKELSGSYAHVRSLRYALLLDRKSKIPIRKMIEAFRAAMAASDQVSRTTMSYTRFHQALNARLPVKVHHNTISGKLRDLKTSRHPELSSIFTPDGVSGGYAYDHYLEMNPEAAKNFLKISKNVK